MEEENRLMIEEDVKVEEEAIQSCYDFEISNDLSEDCFIEVDNCDYFSIYDPLKNEVIIYKDKGVLYKCYTSQIRIYYSDLKNMKWRIINKDGNKLEIIKMNIFHYIIM